MSDRLVWIDMEMTGLDPKKERIIEIATLITDGELNILAEGPELVIRQSEELLAGMDEWNTKHHGDSGLTARVLSSEISNDEAEAQTLAFLKEHCAAGAAPLCGNSIHQDRRFLRLYMPKIDEFLHYRHIDVSTVKELGKRWFPSAYGKRPSKVSQHRALDDVRESVAELRYYRSAFFREPSEK